jgi:hypothetical protein
MQDGSAEQCLDVGLNLLGRDVGLVTANYLAVPADEELGEVPFHFIGAQRLWPRSLHVVIKWAVRRTEVARCLGTQMNIQGICQRPVDGDFAENRECDVVLSGAEVSDPFVGTWFLAAELVAR